MTLGEVLGDLSGGYVPEGDIATAGGLAAADRDGFAVGAEGDAIGAVGDKGCAIASAEGALERPGGEGATGDDGLACYGAPGEWGGGGKGGDEFEAIGGEVQGLCFGEAGGEGFGAEVAICVCFGGGLLDDFELGFGIDNGLLCLLLVLGDDLDFVSGVGDGGLGLGKGILGELEIFGGLGSFLLGVGVLFEQGGIGLGLGEFGDLNGGFLGGFVCCGF